MFLGVWYNPFSWGEDILNAIVGFFYWLFVFIDCIIYSFISYVYQIFLVLAQGGKLIDDKFINDLVGRIYIILGVIMLFIIAYSLLKSMVNPDEALKGKKSPVNIIKDVVISVALIALLPSIFEFAFAFQNSLLINNTIGKIIVGASGNGSKDPADTIRKGGYLMAEGVYSAFLHASEGYCNTVDEEDNEEDINGDTCEIIMIDEDENYTYGDVWDDAEDHATLFVLLQVTSKIVSGEVSYYFLIAPISGIFVLFVLLSYCLDMALRLVKLAVYEVIAPIPIFARIMPNEQVKKVFDNWVKAVTSTFTEVFIRIAILYFAVFIISAVTSSIPKIFTSVLISGSARLDILLIAQALIIIGIIMFVKQSPEILKEITGVDSGKYNVLGSAMKGFTGLGIGATTFAQSLKNTNWDKDHKVKSAWNKFKNPIKDSVLAMTKNHGTDYKSLSDIGKNYDKITNDNLSDRRRKEAIRKAKQINHDKNKDAGMFLGVDWKMGWQDFVNGAPDTKAIEEKIKLSDSVGKDIKSKIIDEAIDKNLRVKQLDNAWKALQNKAVDASDYFERITAENYSSLGLTTADIGSYYDASTGTSMNFNAATEQARTLKQEQEGKLKSQRDKAAFETMYGAIKGDYSVFDAGDVDTQAKKDFVKQYFENLQSQFNSDIEYAKAKSKDIAASTELSELIDMNNYADAGAFKDAIGDRKLKTDTLSTGYNKELAEVRSKEQLKAEIKGDK